MRNPKLVPYETIIRATSGEPEAIDEVLRHYGKRIRLASLENGQVNKDTEDNIKRRLIAALFQFRFDEQPSCISAQNVPLPSTVLFLSVNMEKHGK